jgi:hypothetical protein
MFSTQSDLHAVGPLTDRSYAVAPINERKHPERSPAVVWRDAVEGCGHGEWRSGILRLRSQTT